MSWDIVMLFEEQLEIPKNLEYYRPIPSGARTQRDKIFLQFIKNDNCSIRVVSEDDDYKIECVEQMLSLFSGMDMVVSDSYGLFLAMLRSEARIDDLRNKRKTSCGRHTLSLSSSDWTYFTVRSGNRWGSLFLWADDLTAKQLCQYYCNILLSCKKAGWHIDKILPSQKMFEKLIQDKVSYKMMPVVSEDLSEKVLKTSYSCFKGGRMEACCLGSYLQVFDVDMNSAYFSALEVLPPLHPGCMRWIDSKEYVHDAIFGFCRCHVFIDENLTIGPVAVRMAIPGYPSRLYYPTGELELWLTKDEIDLLSWASVECEILDGVWGVLYKEDLRIFSPVVSVLSKMIEDPVSRPMAKHMASVSWGKFASQLSTLWNPVYSSFITARVRTNITRIASETPGLVAITIDGIATTDPLSEEMLSNKIGGLKMRKLHNMISLTDFYRSFDGNDKEWIVEKDHIAIEAEGGEIRVPFGSTKRLNPRRKLDLKTLQENVFKLRPPTPDECMELYLTKKDLLPSNM